MTEKCFDEGTIQAFLDGELGADLLETIARHTAACQNCARLLREAETESAIAFSALNEEFNTLVPTERIRTNLYEAIAAERNPWWLRIFGDRFSLSSPSIVVFASLLLIIGIFAALWSYHRASPPDANNQFAKTEKAKTFETTPGVAPNASVISDETEMPNAPSNKNNKSKIQQAVYRANFRNPIAVQTANFKTAKSLIKDQKPKIEIQPVIEDRQAVATGEKAFGEESYVKTISTLTANVNIRKDAVLRPSERVVFERDLAVVDDAIAKMQKEVRRNPKNDAARQVLRASYQNKIELLNSVAEKAELMASIK